MELKPYLVKVRYYETDKMGIVHHSNFIRWLEEARLDWLEQLGISFADLEKRGCVSPVMAVSCFGFVPDDMRIIFEPAMITSPTERAKLAKDLSGDVIEAFKCGLINREQALAELKTRGGGAGLWQL